MSTSIRTGAHAVITAACVLASNSSEAQSVCDELSIDHVWYGAFTDTAMEMGVLHSSSVQVNYPSFNIVDSGSDTLNLNYGGLFILPNGNSLHSLPLRDGGTLPASPFSGQVLLDYAAFPGDSTCVFAVNTVDLCPSSCVTAWIDVTQSSAPVNTALFWTVRDTDSNIVASGDMQLNTTDHTQEIDSMCLVPGHYTIEIEQSPFETPAPFTCYFFRDLFHINGPSFSFTFTGTLGFDWFPACFDGSTGIQELVAPSFSWSLDGARLIVNSTDGNALRSLGVHDARGALVHTSSTTADRVTIDLGGCASGMYFISRQDKSRHAAQRFILH